MSALSVTVAVSFATMAYLIMDRKRISRTVVEVETHSVSVQTNPRPMTTNIFAQRRRYLERVRGNASVCVSCSVFP